MPKQGWMQALVEAQGDGAALANSTTPTSLLPAAARYGLYGGFFDRPGKQILVKASGRISNIVTTPGTLTFDLRMGPTSNIIVANGGAMSLNVVAKTNVPWYLVWLLTCRAIGSGTSANLMHQGKWESESVIGSPLPTVGGAGQHMLPNAAPAVGTGFDSTVSMIADLFATWSIANAGNSIQLHQFSLIDLN